MVRKVGGTNEVRARERKTWRFSSFKKKDKERERGWEGESGTSIGEMKRKGERDTRRLWLWTTDHQRGLAYGPDHRRDLVGRTDPSLHQVRKTHLRETMPPRRLGVVKLSWGSAIMGIPMVHHWIETLVLISRCFCHTMTFLQT